jgi:hypothetical protein
MTRIIDKINSCTRTIDKIKVWFFSYFQNSFVKDFVRGYGDLRKLLTWKKPRVGLCLTLIVWVYVWRLCLPPPIYLLPLDLIGCLSLINSYKNNRIKIIHTVVFLILFTYYKDIH